VLRVQEQALMHALQRALQRALQHRLVRAQEAAPTMRSLVVQQQL